MVHKYYVILGVIFALFVAQNFKTKVLTARKNLLLECLGGGGSPPPSLPSPPKKEINKNVNPLPLPKIITAKKNNKRKKMTKNKKNKNKKNEEKKWYPCYYPHWFRDSVSSVCRILQTILSRIFEMLPSFHLGIRDQFSENMKHKKGSIYFQAPSLQRKIWSRTKIN